MKKFLKEHYLVMMIIVVAFFIQNKFLMHSSITKSIGWSMLGLGTYLITVALVGFYDNKKSHAE